MSGAIAELHWFPTHDDQFLTWGSEINLYQTRGVEDVDHNVSSNINLSISNTTSAILLATENRYQYIRCVAPSFRRGAELQLAVGLANGKVGLCNFVSATENNIEFTPKQSRPCVCLAWHESDTNLLAIGHDRNRSDHCITVWDTDRALPKDKSVLHLLGLSETAHSICWDKHSRILMAGMSHKYIKIMDLRQSNPIINASSTRAVHGLGISTNGRLLASFIDNLVNIWDIRDIDKPVITHQMEKNVNCVNWCSTRQSTLAILQRDSPHIQLLDLHSPSNDATISEPFSVKRIISPFTAKPAAGGSTAATQQQLHRNITLSNISWHPNHCERMLALSGSGQIVDFRVKQRVAITFDARNNLCGSAGVQMRCIGSTMPPTAPPPPVVDLSGTTQTDAPPPRWWIEQTDNYIEIGDVVELFYRRTLNDYGKLPDVQLNGILAENEKLVSVWRLIGQTSNRDESFVGLCAILGINNDSTTSVGGGGGVEANGVGSNAVTCTTPTSSSSSYCSGSTAAQMHWAEYPTASPVKVFRNDQRALAQQLCEWTFDMDKPDSLQTFCDLLCTKDEFTRAAMIACFQRHVGLAIAILGVGTERLSDQNLTMAAIALSGLSFEKGNAWRVQCKAVRANIKDPYLRAMFAFLSPDNDPNYEAVLQETSLSIGDRVAFACQYLNDDKLAEYVNQLIVECHETGSLSGLLLTGATPAAIPLIQRFLDWNEDVQTAALIAVRFLPTELVFDDQVQSWIDSYRELLDIWRLWEHRAHLDILIGQLRNPPKHSRSVFLLCSFCCKSVSACLQEESRLRTTATNVNKMSSCPNCRKPLPRCSICLLHMGTTTGWTSPQPADHSASCGGWQSRPFAKWFSWCQTCRHGGHTEHLSEWFEQHSECPVASCSCKCFAVDLAVPTYNVDVLSI